LEIYSKELKTSTSRQTFC